MKQQQEYHERRAYQRATLDREIEVCLLPGEEAEGELSLIACQGRDISGGGVSFFSTSKYPNESLVRMRIPLNNGDSQEISSGDDLLKVLGKVVWCKKNGERKTYVVGVRFLNIYEQDYQMLKKLCTVP